MQSIEEIEQEDDATAMFRRILVPVDFSAVSHRAVYAALEFQRVYGSQLCVFHAAHGGGNDQFLAGLGSPTSTGDVADTSAVRRFLNNIAPGRVDAVECDATMDDDYVASIQSKTRKWGATMIILSHEPHTSLLRTHSEKIMKSLEVPVLLLPPSSPTKA